MGKVVLSFLREGGERGVLWGPPELWKNTKDSRRNPKRESEGKGA